MKRVMVFCLGLMILLTSSAWEADEAPSTALLKKLEEFAKKCPTEKVAKVKQMI